MQITYSLYFIRHKNIIKKDYIDCSKELFYLKIDIGFYKKGIIYKYVYLRDRYSDI